MYILELIANVNIFALAPSIFFVVDSCPIAAKMGYSIFSSNCHPFFHGRQHLAQGSNGVFF